MESTIEEDVLLRKKRRTITANAGTSTSSSGSSTDCFFNDMLYADQNSWLFDNGGGFPQEYFSFFYVQSTSIIPETAVVTHIVCNSDPSLVINDWAEYQIVDENQDGVIECVVDSHNASNLLSASTPKMVFMDIANRPWPHNEPHNFTITVQVGSDTLQFTFDYLVVAQ
ncbi:MAG: hypothetical protein KTR13_07070 [Saprospiraceae bacterium]|nr:hypothetical protein [Saprospiraceae bacterium]